MTEPEPEPAPERALEVEGPRTLTVAQLGRTIRRALDSDFRQAVWVSGEVSGARPASSGHMYFTLKDSAEDAALDVAIYKSSLTPRARACIKDGNHVRLRGKPQFWAPRGRLQFIADAAELAGEGALLLALEKRKAMLAAEGLFKEERKRKLPHSPRIIGVVTSSQGAVIHDIVKVAFQRGGANILLAPALVQGAGAARSVLLAITALEKVPHVDVIIVGRGGGSADDLQAFNDEDLVRKVASCRVPIVSAVGHEVDVTLVDFAADARAATPSQAAEMTVPDVRAELRLLNEQHMRLRRLTTARAAAERHELASILRRFPSPARFINEKRQALDDQSERITDAISERIREERSAINALEKRLERCHPRAVLERERTSLVSLRERMARKMGRRIASEKSAMSGLVSGLSAMSPLKVLARGYAIATRKDGRAVRSSAELAPGEVVRVRVHEGEFAAGGRRREAKRRLVKFGVIGDPVAHSKSPAMHTSAYRALRMPHTYEAHRVPKDDLRAWVDRVRQGEIAGLNVTVPHKEAVLAFVDVVDETARDVAAANTLVCRAGKVIAYNTDIPALAEEILSLAPDLSRADFAAASGLILGSGGTARSAVASLARHLRLRKITVRARAFDKDAACTHFRKSVESVLGDTLLELEVLSAQSAEAPREEPQPLVVVQATSAGMTGKDSGDSIARAVSFASLKARAVALDVIYSPARTPFLDAAERAGVRATNGLGMLARQGALAFELWLAVPAPYNAMLSALT